MIGFFERSIERVENINWDIKERDKPSHYALVTEFIRRGNVFRDIFEKDNNKRLAIFSAAEIIGADVALDINLICNELGLDKRGWIINYLCKYYLEWSYLFDSCIEARQYQDIYMPMIVLFERGGRVSYHNNELISGHYFWPRNCYTISRYPELNIDNDELNKMDTII